MITCHCDHLSLAVNLTICPCVAQTTMAAYHLESNMIVPKSAGLSESDIKDNQLFDDDFENDVRRVAKLLPPPARKLCCGASMFPAFCPIKADYVNSLRDIDDNKIEIATHRHCALRLQKELADMHVHPTTLSMIEQHCRDLGKSVQQLKTAEMEQQNIKLHLAQKRTRYVESAWEKYHEFMDSRCKCVGPLPLPKRRRIAVRPDMRPQTQAIRAL